MRILVAGANGQVGHELLRALAKSPSLQGESLPKSPFLQGESSAKSPPLQGEGLGGDGVDVGSTPNPIPTPALPSERRESSSASREIIPAIRDGTLNGAAFRDQAGIAPCQRIDLADFADLTRTLDRIAPDLIINAAAYTAVDRAEDEPERAMRINADAVGVLGEWAARHAARVVHYSTDYVFDGSATRPYREDDATRPLGVYGRTKLAGERALRESGARHLILRTAWVYGARGHNFLRTMLKLGAERDELRVVDDQIGVPTSAALIADVTVRAVARWFDPDESGGSTLDGTYHLVASGQTSWCGFARAIFERAARERLLERTPRVQAIATADYPTSAKRPAYSVLDPSKLRDTFQIDPPDWRRALDDVIDELARS